MGCKKLIKNREFVRFLLSGMLNRMGDSIDMITMSWLVYILSGSASMSALAVAVNYVPTILFQPFAGAFVERCSKKKVLALMDLGRVILVLLMILLYRQNILRPSILLMITFTISTLESFRSPATLGALPRIISAEEYDVSMSTYQIVSSVMELAGTGAAGILIAVMGVYGALAIDALFFFLSGMMILLVHIQGEEKDGRHEKASYLKTLVEGFRYMRSSKILILLAFICTMLNGVIAPLQALQAALVKDIYGRGSEALSLIDGCLSAGTLVGAFCYPLLAGRISVDKALLTCGILNGGFYFVLVGLAGITGFPLVFNGGLGIACLVFGLSAGFLNTTLSVLLMKVIPVEYMARESALVGAVSIGAIPLTSSLVSVAAVRVSVPVILACFGGITILLMVGLKISGKLNCLREIRNEDKCEEEMQLD